MNLSSSQYVFHINTKANLRLLVTGLLLNLIAACSGLQPTGQEATKVNESELNADGSPVAIEIKDPMAEPAPLALIKVYDQVKPLVTAKNYAQAEALLKQAVVNFPKHSGPDYRLARLYHQQKDAEKALGAVEASVAINSLNYYALNLQGVILRELGRFADAKQAYLLAIAAKPNYASSHLNLAILADIYLYDLPLALQHFETYQSLQTNEDKKVAGWLLDLKRRLPKGEVTNG